MLEMIEVFAVINVKFVKAVSFNSIKKVFIASIIFFGTFEKKRLARDKLIVIKFNHNLRIILTIITIKTTLPWLCNITVLPYCTL